jgi:hypothetical protein
MNPANIVFLELKTINEQAVELRYRLPGQAQYEPRTLQLAEIASLYDFADRDCTRQSPDLAKMGFRSYVCPSTLANEFTLVRIENAKAYCLLAEIQNPCAN